MADSDNDLSPLRPENTLSPISHKSRTSSPPSSKITSSSHKNSHSSHHHQKHRSFDDGPDRDISPPRKHGLQNAESFEIHHRHRNHHKADPSLTGKEAETIIRDKHGRRLSGLEAMLAREKGQIPEEVKGMEWGKGLVQKNKEEEFAKYLHEESQKPFARYADDDEINQMLREQDRFGDPMMMIKNLENLSDNEFKDFDDLERPKKKIKHHHSKKSKSHSHSSSSSSSSTSSTSQNSLSLNRRPMYQRAPWPNRYNILPGYRWDGADRSNGWEQHRFTFLNEKSAKDTELYQYNVMDM